MAHKPLYLNTRTVTSHLFFGPYALFPLIAALTWLGGILALLILWVREGKPRYRGDEASVVFISDVGAVHKTLFICICCVTVAFYMLGLFAERWLRHVDRLPTDLRKRERIYDWLAIFFAAVGSAGLVLLSCFDAFNHSTIHWTMTLVFIVGVALSAIFQSLEIWFLHKDHPDRKSLLRNSILKDLVVVIALACAITFGATYAVCGGDATAYKGHTAETCNRITSVAAAFEWTIAFILTFYFLTIVADLWPAGKSSPRYMRRLAKWQERHGEGDDFTGRRAFQEYPDRWQESGAAPGAGAGGWRARADGMQQAMWERNAGVTAEGRDSMASHAPMMTNGAVGNGHGYEDGQMTQAPTGYPATGYPAGRQV